MATCTVVVLRAGDPFSPARYRAGALPAMPVQAVGGGQVFLELTVSDAGTVDVVRPLRTTPPFTEALVDVVRRWQFVPAEETVDGTSPPQRVPSQVLVATSAGAVVVEVRSGPATLSGIPAHGSRVATILCGRPTGVE